MTHSTPRPTAAELAILDVLWSAGPSTVRQVHETLQCQRGSRTGYTTVLKLMQIMADKELVKRDESRRSHVYRPHLTRSRARRKLVGELIDLAFSGSTSQLVLSALSAKPASEEELACIRRFLDEQESRQRKGRS